MKKVLLVFLLFAMSNNLLCQNSTQIKVAVLDLKSLGVGDHFSLILSERLRSELFKYEKYKVMSRESMKDIMDEQVFQMSGTCDENSCYIKLGAILSVEKIVAGSIGKLGNTYSLTVKIISVETGEIEDTFTDSKKCAEDDLFTMIENAAKLLTRGNNTKILSPEDVKEIKEIQPQRSTPTDGFISANDDIKEWEIVGLTRNEFIEYKRCGVDFSNWRNIEEFRIKNYLSHSENISYLSSGLTFEEWIKNNHNTIYDSVYNSTKSLILPGWGNNKRRSYYFAIEILWASTFLIGVASSNDFDMFDAEFLDWGNQDVTPAINLVWITFSLNRVISSIDAFIESNKYDESFKQKYKLSLSPTYNLQNKAVGLGFTVNF